MAAKTLSKPRKKLRVQLPEEPPFPVPIETLTNKPASNSNWFYYCARMINDKVVVQNEGDIVFLHRMGFFGKGILSRSRPEHQHFASSFQGVHRKNLPPQERRFQQQRFQQVRQHKYERHLSWKKQIAEQRKRRAEQAIQKETVRDLQADHLYKVPMIPLKRVKRATISERNQRAGIITVDRKPQREKSEDPERVVPVGGGIQVPEVIQGVGVMTKIDEAIGRETMLRSSDACVLTGTNSNGTVAKENLLHSSVPCVSAVNSSGGKPGSEQFPSSSDSTMVTDCKNGGDHVFDHGPDHVPDRGTDLKSLGNLRTTDGIRDFLSRNQGPEKMSSYLPDKVLVDEEEMKDGCNLDTTDRGVSSNSKSNVCHSEQNVHTKPEADELSGLSSAQSWSREAQRHVLESPQGSETYIEKHSQLSTWETKQDDWGDVCKIGETSKIASTSSVEVLRHATVESLRQETVRHQAESQQGSEQVPLQSSWETNQDDWTDVRNVDVSANKGNTDKVGSAPVWITDSKDWQLPDLTASGAPHVQRDSSESKPAPDHPRVETKSLDTAGANVLSHLEDAMVGTGEKRTVQSHIEDPKVEPECVVTDQVVQSRSCSSSFTTCSNSTNDSQEEFQRQRQFWMGTWTSSDPKDSIGDPDRSDVPNDAKESEVPTVHAGEEMPGHVFHQNLENIDRIPGDPDREEQRQERFSDLPKGHGHSDVAVPRGAWNSGAFEGYPQGQSGQRVGGRNMEWDRVRTWANNHHLEAKDENLETRRKEEDVGDGEVPVADASSDEDNEGGKILQERDDACFSDSHGNADVIVAVPTPVEFDDATTSQTESNNLLCFKGKNIRKKTRDVKAPVRHNDPYPVSEYLQLSYEEAFFLSYGLGCLKVENEDEKPLNLTEMWRLFRRHQSTFVAKYIVYHFFRSKGWVPKTGLKFGADFILYKKGPPFYHASYCVYVAMLDEEDIVDRSSFHPKTWAALMGMDRVIQNAAKELMFCFVIKPRSLSKQDLDSPACIPRFRVQEILMKRWVPSRERQQTPENGGDNDNVEIS